MSTRKKIIYLTAADARKYFLLPSSYVKFDLPNYFDFSDILCKSVKIYNKRKNLGNIAIDKKHFPNRYDDVNSLILDNKDGKNAWRPLSLIHPIIYVHLVYILTEQNAWRFLQKHFNKNRFLKISCTSIPIDSDCLSKSFRTKEQILEWWEEVEQTSFKIAMEYPHVIKTDITDCYNSIYTHSISWALHGRPLCKKMRQGIPLSPGETTALGDSIDHGIQEMQCGQTHGIPQGSVLMDFIAEIVLAAIDNELADRIEKDTRVSKEYKIVRYRDDYRIFAKEKKSCEIILKLLGDVLREYGLSLNSKKTVEVHDVISESLKHDKWELINSPLLLSLMRAVDYHDGFVKKMQFSYQKLMLQIYDFSLKHPNAGQLMRLLSAFSQNLPASVKKEESEVMISIIVNIALACPKVYPHCVAILSKLMLRFSPNEQRNFLKKILNRFEGLPNTDFFNIWMQRIAEPAKVDFKCSTPLCQAVANFDKVKTIWNNEWMKEAVRNDFETQDVVNRGMLMYLQFEVQLSEILVFKNDEY